MQKKISNIIKKIKKNPQKKIILGVVIFFVLILGVIFYQVPKWTKQYQLRTRFYKTTEKLSAISEEQARGDIAGQCDKIRNSADRLYLADEIVAEMEKNQTGEKIKLVGKSEANAENQSGKYLLLNIQNKEVELVCFDFSQRVIVEGGGQIEFSLNNFKNIQGNALSLNGGEGKIHHNLIEKSSKAGIFANEGKWEIYGNIIKDNLSYGVYGGYEADILLRENAILNNGGYEVRILKERKVFD
ncbi:MAG: right-handed parallel beta-helix repeat-containing protein [Candidatus Moraniibacteriota bacterium]